jgi:hypothetical protein
MKNTWPGGKRKVLSQVEHETWNSAHYPCTRQICIICNEPTGFCEEDSTYCCFCETGPLCTDCIIIDPNGDCICQVCFENLAVLK